MQRIILASLSILVKSYYMDSSSSLLSEDKLHLSYALRVNFLLVASFQVLLFFLDVSIKKYGQLRSLKLQEKFK